MDHVNGFHLSIAKLTENLNQLSSTDFATINNSTALPIYQLLLFVLQQFLRIQVSADTSPPIFLHFQTDLVFFCFCVTPRFLSSTL